MTLKSQAFVFQTILLLAIATWGFGCEGGRAVNVLSNKSGNSVATVPNDPEGAELGLTSSVVAAPSNRPLVFDAEFYRFIYPDLASLTNDGLWSHYLNHGIAEGRLGSPALDPVLVKKTYPDLASMTNLGILEHWLSAGIDEIRFASSVFDDTFYRQKYQDLEVYDRRGLIQHFLAAVINEGRAASPFFDVQVYRSRQWRPRCATEFGNLEPHGLTRSLGECGPV